MKEFRFTRSQSDAIDVSRRDEDTCVVAGPGSGKTTVLVEYFSRLVAAGVDPLRILAITFTEKAAGNMRSRLAGAFSEDAGLRARLERSWVSTIHGFCARLLRENAVAAGVDPEFRVADERDSWRLQQHAIADAVDSLFREHPERIRRLIRGLSSFEFEGAVLSAYDAMRSAGISAAELPAFPAPAGTGLEEVAAADRALRNDPAAGWSVAQRIHLRSILDASAQLLAAARTSLEAALRAVEEFRPSLQKCKRSTSAYTLVESLRDCVQEFKYSLITELYTGERATLMDILRRFDAIYRERKLQEGLLDFADLEEHTVRLLEGQPGERERLQAQFDHVLIDEFQDTNEQQSRLVELIRKPDRLYAVGDINQSIFGFRHAELQGFRNYRDGVARRGRRVVELVDNFRSRPEILRAVETITAHAPGIEPRELEASGDFDTARETPVELLCAVAADADRAQQLEAAWMARRVIELTRGQHGLRFGDIAVLVRNTEVIADFTDAFDQASVPYVVNRGRGFFEGREVRDMIHLLRAIANPLDEISMAAVLRSPIVGVPDEALLRLKLDGENLGAALLAPKPEADGEPEESRLLEGFRENLRNWRARREYVSFDRPLLAAIDESGYQPQTGARGAANLDKFLAQAREASRRMSLDEFVEDLARVREADPREPDAPPEDSADAVKIMTVHSAKGLEFPVVFVAALHKGTESGPPVVAFSPRIGLGARWRNPAKREEKDDLFQHAIREERRQREREESDRLLYVAMTRAEHQLTLSFSAAKKPSNWAETVTQALGIEGSAPVDDLLPFTAPNGQAWTLHLHVVDRPPEPVESSAPRLAETGPELVEALEYNAPELSNVTVTALARYADCPRKYYLGSYLGFEGGRPEPEDPDSPPRLSAGDFGIQVHAVLAGTTPPDADPEAIQLAETFRRSTLGKRVERASRVEREFDFLMAVEDVVVSGQVDLWFEEGGELVIVDYKTDSVAAAEARQRAHEYELQLRMYAMAVERVAGRAVDRAFLVFLRPNTSIEISLAPSLLESPEGVIAELQNSLAGSRFPLREGEHCRRCQFFHDLCPAAYADRPKARSAPRAAVKAQSDIR